MSVNSRLLTFLVAVLLLAQPAMACCLTGHPEPQTQQTVHSEPPCHSDNADVEPVPDGASRSLPGLAYCAGCLDCENPVLQAQTASDSAALPNLTYEMPVALLVVLFPGFEHPSIESKTGPPHPPPLITRTPLTLKQRLLI